MPDLDCRHHELILLPPPDKRLRCRHCHLVIGEKDLADGNCPECWEVSGMKRRDFEPVASDGGVTTRYRCESCGAIING
jgi:phage FluMu protein Com